MVIECFGALPINTSHSGALFKVHSRIRRYAPASPSLDAKDKAFFKDKLFIRRKLPPQPRHEVPNATERSGVQEPKASTRA